MPKTLIFLALLGAGTAYSSDRESARPLLIQTIKSLTAEGPSADGQLSAAYNSLGMIDLQASNLRDGEANLSRAAALAANAFGEDDYRTSAWRTNLALAFVLEKQFDRATTLLNRLLATVKTGQLRAIVYAELSAAALGQGKFTIAEDYALQEIAIMEAQTAPNSATLALAEVNLANIYIREGRADDAERILPAAVERERLLLSEDRALADGILRLAELRAKQQAFSDSAALYREAIGLYEHKLGQRSRELAPVRKDYAAVLKRSRRAG